MAFHFRLVLLGVILLNGMVLGDDSTSSGALAGADGERNAPSRGGEAGCKSEGRARNGDNLVVLASARTTPSEAGRKSDSVVKRVSGQSSLRNRNEARNDHVGVGNELHDQPATSHKARTSAGDKRGMKLPHALGTAASGHGEGGLTSTSPKKSAEVLDRKKEFENVVSGIIGEEAEAVGDGGSSGSVYGECPHDVSAYCSYAGGGVQPGDEVPSGESSPSEQKDNSTSGSASSSSASAVSSSDNSQSPVTGNGDEAKTKDGEATKDEQDREKQKKEKKKKKDKEEKEEKEENEKENEEELLNEQKSDENSDGWETNSSSEDAENEEAPSSGNSAFLSGSCSSVLLVALACLCAC
ncbi:hypothetical protein ERJ75_000858000 [Trypanosoma vivax]|nr:hypothetical protein ERJ75_000858000 [Trypanosoma vivax]